MIVKRNRSYYCYEASYRVWYEDKTIETRQMRQDTDILYNRLHIWNKKHLTSRYREMMEEDIARGRVVSFELLEEELVLVSRYVYDFVD